MRSILVKGAAAALLLLVATAVLAQEGIGVLKRYRGDVAIERGGMRLKAVKGTELQRGDRLITGDKAYAYVEMRGTGPLAVGPETEVALDRFAGETKRVTHRAPRLLQGLASYLALNRHR